jgi:cellulase (glycosyl hydrolase family 5)
VVAIALFAATAAQAAPSSIETGFFDPNASAGGAGVAYSWLEPGPALARVRKAGASIVRIPVLWGRIDGSAPGGSGDNWFALDQVVEAARARHMKILFTIYNGPSWAGGRNGNRPDLLAAFAVRASTRYPDVRLWQVWNEPNNQHFLQRPNRVEKYRAMVNQVAAVLRPRNPQNLIVAGGSSPFGHPEIGNGGATPPMTFMRQLLTQPTHFDIWAHHPYTRGGPTKQAVRRNDASIGDLSQMRRILVRAVRGGKVIHRVGVRFWVTEFLWDSKGPDPCGVPLALHARWTAEAVYRMWRAGVTAVMWSQLRDYPFVRSSPGSPGIPYQGGLYRWGGQGKFGRAKPALKAFRFPFVALRRPGGAYVWGRTKGGAPGRVLVQRRTSGGWRTIARIRTNRHGLFQRRLFKPLGTRSVLRAKKAAGGPASLPFSLRVPRAPNPLPQPLGC